MALDRISKILNEAGGKGVSGDALDDLEDVMDRVVESLSL
jgi:hypothetical protein